MPESRVRELVRSGLCRPARRGRRYSFDFTDLVALRAAQGLLDQGIALARVRRALAALVEQLPPDRAVSGIRIFADGRQVAVRDGDARWEPETGQILLDFDVGPLERQVASLADHAAPTPGVAGPRNAHDHFELALELEDTDPAAAADAYTRALNGDPELVDAYVNLGRITHEAGDAKEATRLYRRALESAPADPVIHFNLALALEDTETPPIHQGNPVHVEYETGKERRGRCLRFLHLTQRPIEIVNSQVAAEAVDVGVENSAELVARFHLRDRDPSKVHVAACYLRFNDLDHDGIMFSRRRLMSRKILQMVV